MVSRQGSHTLASSEARQGAFRRQIALSALLLAGLGLAGAAAAQEVRYSWFEIAYVHQEAAETGTSTNPLLNQTVEVATRDGGGVGFRGSFGTWHNLYAFFDYNSVDADVDAVVSNDQGVFPASDEFDLTTISGGLGLRIPLRYSTDLYFELTYDSLDYDLGSFATEDFDTGDQGAGAALGLRHVLGDDFEVRAHARHTTVGNADFNTREVDDDTLYGAGIGYTFIRGLSVSLDYESGEIETWSVGFRLDLDED
jgi:hypothetical protein